HRRLRQRSRVVRRGHRSPRLPRPTGDHQRSRAGYDGADADPSRPAREAPPARATSARGGGVMSLVLCDDHRMFVDALAMALRSCDHDVVATCSDLQALPGVLQQARPDLCVRGVQYGGRVRLETLETMRASVPGISVLVLTGWATENVWRLYDSRTIDGLVSKTVDIRTVDLAVRRVLAGEHVVEGLARPVPASSRAPENEPLTAREREVIELLVDGVSTVLMAESLGVSTNTVRSHVQNVLRKLGVHHRSKAAHRALELGLVRVAGSPG